MVLRYNWPKIFTVADGQGFQCWTIFKMLAENQIPYGYHDPKYKYAIKDFKGDSFLLHPDVLIYNAYKYSYRDLSIYLALASLRNYGEYKASSKTTLELIKSPVHPHEFLDDQTLLPIEGNYIKFPYEEVPAKELQH
jgi:hypothetical protein